MTAYVRQATAVSSQRAMEVFERLNSLVNLVIDGRHRTTVSL